MTGGSPAGGGSNTASTATAPAQLSVSFLQYTPVQTASKRRAQFVSPATASISLNLVSVNGATPSTPVSTTIAIGANANGCTTSGNKITCNASFNAPVGNDVLTATSYDGSGTTLGTSTIATTIQSNATNTLSLSIGGVIANLEMFLTNASFTVGTAAKALLVIVPLDSSGAQIVNPGNYNPSIAVTSSDTSGNFSLIFDGSNAGTSATVASPSDQVVLNYSGSSAASTNVTATAGTGISQTVNASASAVSAPGLSSHIGGTYTSSTPNHFQFTALGQTGTLTVSGGTSPYTVTSSDTTVATVSGSSPNFTVTATGYGTNGLGTATLTITDSASPTPATRTESVTVVPPTLSSSVLACGSSATCTTTSESFSSGTSSGLGSTFSLSGGTSTYAFSFVSSGSTTSSFATASIAGSTITVTPNGAGSDVLLVTSGSQSLLIAINDTAPPAGGYAIASTAHAYSPSANTLTMSYNTADQATATLTTSTGSAPWTVTSSNPSVVTVTASQSGYLLTAAGTGTSTITLTPATGTAPTPLAVTVIPNLSLSTSSIALHAIGDAYSITASNATPGGLVIGSSSISASPTGIVTLGSFTAPTLSGVAQATGSTSVIFRDTNVDRKVVASVLVDSSYSTQLQTALAPYGSTALGLPSNTASTVSGLPSWITSVSATGALSGSSYASQTLSVSSNPAATGTITFNDSIGGSVTIPYALLSFSYGYPGASIGAAANEAFTAAGQTDTVGVSDGTAGHTYTATSSSTSVVTASGGSGVVNLTAVAPGTATITVVDTSESNATTTFTVSVTTTTIPIASKARR